MTDRESLVAALDWYADMTYLDNKDATMVTAARERLAQLPLECPECQGTLSVEPPISGPDPHGVHASSPCFACNQTGKVYPAELVELIAQALLGRWGQQSAEFVQNVYRTDAIAVLDAINERAT